MPQSSPKNVDVLVVGAGPAGLAAARALVKSGAHTMMVDARERMGHPLRCAEISSKRLFADLDLPPHKEWIRWFLKRPKGLLVLNRPKLEEQASKILESLGVVVRPGTSVVGVGPYDGEGRVVTLATRSTREVVRARLVIAADGVASTVACLAGAAQPLKLGEMASCLAVRLKGVKLADPYSCETMFPPQIRPFYASVIPSGSDEALVGLGVLATRGHAAKPLLDQIMGQYPELTAGKVVQTVVGFVPSVPPLARPFADGLLVTGTAARFIDAAAGAGIEYAAASGKIAAAVYLNSNRRDTSAVSLAPYRKRLEPLYGALHMGVLRRWLAEHGKPPHIKHGELPPGFRAR